MGGTSTIFTGTSRYASDFQQIIDRAVAIASLPKAQLEAEKTTISDRSNALSAIDTRFAALASAIQNLNSAVSATPWSSSISNGTVISASVGDDVLQGTYSITVVDTGSHTSVMSQDNLSVVTDPSEQNISSSTSFTLTVDGAQYSLQLQSPTLWSLAKAINSANAGVQAVVVNIGSSSAPDYRLSLCSAKLGPVAIQLNDGAQDLVQTLAVGTLASYQINGQPSNPISSNSDVVTVAPGLTVTLLNPGTANITVTKNTGAISTAFASFVSAYNAAVDELDKHYGKDAGALRGDSLIYSLTQALRSIGGYAATNGDLSSLSSLGLSFDEHGKLSLDTSTLSQAMTTDFDRVATFLGGGSDEGFLQFASDVMNGLEDSTSGVIKTALNDYQAQLAAQDARIATEQERVDRLEQSLQEQMSAADALIASLEQQANYITGLFEAMRNNQSSQK